jgi:hypothetical protein
MQVYSPTHLDRVNPEFIGIATKYSTAKKHQTALEEERNNLIRNLNYKINVDAYLEKGLQEARGKLQSAQKVQRRHLVDL